MDGAPSGNQEANQMRSFVRLATAVITPCALETWTPSARRGSVGGLGQGREAEASGDAAAGGTAPIILSSRWGARRHAAVSGATPETHAKRASGPHAGGR
jgi:hypothetical protein